MPDFSDIDPAVVRRAKAGDRIALTRLLYDNNLSLRSQLAGRVPRELAAILSLDDIVQETCLRVQEGIRKLNSDHPQGFVIWVRRIAENVLNSKVRELRSRKRGGHWNRVVESSDRGEYVTGILDNALTPARATERNEVIIAIRTNIGDLASTERRALQLRHIEKKTVAETADALGKSPGEVRGILDRGENNLRDAMGRSSKWFPKK